MTKKTKKQKRYLLSFLYCVCIVDLTTSFALAGEHMECVGNYVLRLSDDADVATTTPHVFDERDHQEYIVRPIRFPDDEPAPLSIFGFNGNFKIIKNATLSDFDKLVLIRRKELTNLPQNDRLQKKEIPTSRQQSFAYAGDTSAGFILYENETIIAFSTGPYLKGPEIVAQEEMQATLSGLRYRSKYEIPKQDGICLPWMYVAHLKRNFEIGTTFRLNQHPDITILFKAKASHQQIKTVDVHNMPVGRQTNLTSREQNEFVWMYSGLGKQVKLAHDPIPFHTVTIDGRKGVGSFGTITRGDGSTDYGYLVTVQGDPDAAVDTPDLLLLVERTAKNAKGNSPVTPEELKAIAKDIAASIKRRAF